jgi:hypothetical protein
MENIPHRKMVSKKATQRLKAGHATAKLKRRRDTFRKRVRK